MEPKPLSATFGKGNRKAHGETQWDWDKVVETGDKRANPPDKKLTALRP